MAVRVHSFTFEVEVQVETEDESNYTEADIEREMREALRDAKPVAEGYAVVTWQVY